MPTSRLPLIVAALLFLVSGVGASYSYSALLDRRTGLKHAWLTQVPGGVSRFSIMSHEKCVGMLETTLEHGDDIYQVHSLGALHLRMPDNSFLRPRIDFQATFNRFGQLGGSILHIVEGPTSINIGTSDINPIRVRIRSDLAGNTINYETYLPGPVLIKANQDGTYRLEIPAMANLKKAYDSIAAQPGFQTFGISLQPLDPLSAVCGGEHVEAVDLSSWLSQVQGYLQKLTSFSNGE